MCRNTQVIVFLSLPIPDRALRRVLPRYTNGTKGAVPFKDHGESDDRGRRGWPLRTPEKALRGGKGCCVSQLVEQGQKRIHPTRGRQAWAAALILPRALAQALPVEACLFLRPWPWGWDGRLEEEAQAGGVGPDGEAVCTRSPVILTELIIFGRGMYSRSRWSARGLRWTPTNVSVPRSSGEAPTHQGDPPTLRGPFIGADVGDRRLLGTDSLRPGPKGRETAEVIRSQKPLFLMAKKHTAAKGC
ncbi:hypothetical protein FDECE_16917 [Fusarium decemcellulare]|nr:hypothetical protein FDECE_16917 [Fusarium decemcellulare]